MQNVSKKRVYRMSHSGSLRRSIFLYPLEHEMVQLYPWLHFTFKELSNDTSHTQIRVKTKKLWPQQVGQRKLCRDKVFCRIEQTLSQQRKLCHDRENSVTIEKLCRNRENSVATKKPLSQQRKLYRNRETLSQ